MMNMPIVLKLKDMSTNFAVDMRDNPMRVSPNSSGSGEAIMSAPNNASDHRINL